MSNVTKTWLILAAVLIVVGLIIFASIMSIYNWDFKKLSTTKYETNTYEINQEFSGIFIDTSTADVTLVLSNDGKCKIECYEQEKEKHSATVSEDNLVVKVVNEKAWYDYVGIGVGTPKIKIYLPKTQYAALNINESTGNIEIPQDFNFTSANISLSTGHVNFYACVDELLKIKTSTGSIEVNNITVGALDLTVSTGGITVKDVNCIGDAVLKLSTGKTNLNNLKCVNITTDASTGDINLNKVIATEKISINRTTGDVVFDHADAAEILVTTDTGDVEGTLLTDKVFITSTDTGNVDVPKTITGGRCEITTDTGDIEISVIKE